MSYLITGAIICLIGIGLMQMNQELVGIIVLLIGVSLGLKGRNKLDGKR